MATIFVYNFSIHNKNLNLAHYFLKPKQMFTKFVEKEYLNEVYNKLNYGTDLMKTVAMATIV